MKKIAFILSSMNMGGTEKVLLNMINSMDFNEYDIDIYLLEKKGALLKDVPKNVNLYEIENYKEIKNFVHDNIYVNFRNELKKLHFFKAVKLGIAYTTSKIKDDITIYYDSFSNVVNSVNEEYDLVAAYEGPMNFITYLVDKKFNSYKKAAWIHFDISKMGYTSLGASSVYDNIDQIFIVSEYAKRQFINEFPKLEEKCKVFYNILPKSKIIKKGDLLPEVFFDSNYINILTIGRISRQKGQDIIPKIIYLLKKEGYSVRWYLIGGIEKYDSEDPVQVIRKEEIKYGISDEIVFLGIKDNPYPYIKMCDIYVQPSRYEGYCTTTNEAKLFNVPIITTNVSGADEQFINGITGIITELDCNKIANEIMKIICDDALSSKLKNNLKIENRKTINDSDNLLCEFLKKQ